MEMHNARIEALGDGTLQITVSKSFDGESADGYVVVRGNVAPDPGSAPHATLAESRAFLSLGEKLFAQKRFQSAIEIAERGLLALGRDYASIDVDDDTNLKLLAAEDQIDKGNIGNAASTMLRVLKNRTELYTALHHSSIVR